MAILFTRHLQQPPALADTEPVSLTQVLGDVCASANSPLVADIYEGSAQSIIDGLAPEWRELCTGGGHNQPHYRPEWIAAYIAAFAPDARLVLIAVRQRGRLSAVLPLMRERGRFYGIPVRKLRSPANVHSGRFDLVLGAMADRRACAAAVWAAAKTLSGWDILEIDDVPAGGTAHELVAQAATDGYPTGVRETFRTPYLTLPLRPEATQESTAFGDAKFRANLRRRLKKLEQRGPVRLVRVHDADGAALERFYALERAGWKGEAGTAILCDPATRRFYDEVARGAARHGYFSMYFLECDGRAIAGHFGLTCGGRYCVPKVAFDEAFRECAPGHLIVEAILRDCVRRGLSEFDFLGPSLPWKSEWTPDVRVHESCYIFRRGPIGRILHGFRFRAVPVARAVVRQCRAERAACDHA